MGDDIPPSELDDDALRDRIYSRYVAYNGLSRKDDKDVFDLLPRSSVSVFTHGDLCPRNIIVNDDCHIVGLLDWESSGGFPDYWDLAQMMKFCDPAEHEWQEWIRKAMPQAWDVSGIQKARRVLF